MRGFASIPAAGFMFFFSAWLTMIFWGIFAPDMNIPTISYVRAMGITIALWLVVAPLVGAASGSYRAAVVVRR